MDAYSGDRLVKLDALSKQWSKIKDAMGEFHKNKKLKHSCGCSY